MENASKALIIAGAILLAILLISLGIMIFNQASSVVSGTGMTDAEITTFNAKFQKYEGSIKGSMVKSLINDIIAVNNDSNDENDITLKAGPTGVTGASVAATGWVNANTTYEVSFGYEKPTGTTADTKGRITNVTIK